MTALLAGSTLRSRVHTGEIIAGRYDCLLLLGLPAVALWLVQAPFATHAFDLHLASTALPGAAVMSCALAGALFAAQSRVLRAVAALVLLLGGAQLTAGTAWFRTEIARETLTAEGPRFERSHWEAEEDYSQALEENSSSVRISADSSALAFAIVDIDAESDEGTELMSRFSFGARGA